MLDILIRDSLLVDGTGNPGYIGYVGITWEKITLVGRGTCNEQAKKIIDGSGLICSPGFIDIHGHADVSLPYYPDVYNLIVQGITSFTGGNCGICLAPAMSKDFYEPYHASLDLTDLDICWGPFSKWIEYAKTLPLKANYIPLVGLNPIRGSVLGKDYERPSTDEEIERELLLLKDALDAGAFGLSLSLDPGIAGHFSDRKELDRMCEYLQEREVLITAHTRHHQTQWPSEDGRTFYGYFIGHKGEVMCGRYQGLVEFMEYYRRFPKLRAVISHLTNGYVVPQPHSLELEYAMIDETIDTFVNQPNRDGCDVYFDVIPAQQSISSAYRIATPMIRNMPYDDYLKDYATEDKMIQGLKDPEFRRKMRDFINGGKFKLTMLHPATDPYWAAAYTIIKSTDESVVGKTLIQVTEERMPGTHMEMIYNNCIEVLFDLLVADPMIEGAMTLDKREYAMERMIINPRCMPMTDTISLPEKPDMSRNIMGYGTPPIAYSLFCKFLTDMCRDGHYLKMEEAFRRITSLPAEVLRIKNRGVLKEGNYADITMLDWNNLHYSEDYLSPSERPRGIINVIINGQFAMQDGEVKDSRSGYVLNRMKD